MNRKDESKKESRIVSSFRQFYSERCKKFISLIYSLVACSFYIAQLKEYYVNNDFKIENLPPGEKDIRRVRRILNISGKVLSQEITTVRGINPYQFKDATKFLKNLKSDLNKINIRDENCFAKMTTFCTHMIFIYKLLWTIDPEKDFRYFAMVETAALLTVGKAQEIIGYWSAKVEEIRRNTANASLKTQKKLAHKKVVRELLSKYDKPSKEFFRDAMCQTDRGERTIKNLVKELQKKIEEDKIREKAIKNLFKELQKELQK